MSTSVLNEEEARRQTNGQTGEGRTVTAFAQHLWIMHLNADLDAADLLVADPKPSNADERKRRTGSSISVHGVIQCKFFERGNAVYINNDYVEDSGRPRAGFFLHVHTNDEQFNPVSYFLFPEDIFALPTDKAGTSRRFSITQEDNKERFLVKSNRDIIQQIKTHLSELENFELHRRALPYLLRARFSLDVEIEYYLKIVRVEPTKIFSDEDEVRLILARTKGLTRSLDARADLQLGGDTFSWGYRGGGPKLTVLTILAHHLGGLPPSRQQVVRFRDYIADLDRENSHVIDGKVVTKFLEGD